MDDSDKDKVKVVTPLVSPHEGSKRDDAPKPVDTGAPASTNEEGERVELPDLGGKID